MPKVLKSLLVFVNTFLLRRSVVVSCAVLLGGFILINYIALPLYVNHGGTLEVPDVTGQPLDQAMKSLQDRQLQPIQAETRPDPSVPAGSVINQNPVAGAKVKEGRRVYLTVSGGEVQVNVPSLRGRTTRDARFALERFGLRLGGVGFAPSTTYPENTIVDQTVAPNTRVPRGTPVGVVVSSGPDTLKIAIPSVAGKSLTDAQRILAGMGLRVGNTTYQKSFDLLPNTVVDQFPRPGELVSRGQPVDLFVVQSGRPAEEIHP